MLTVFSPRWAVPEIRDSCKLFCCSCFKIEVILTECIYLLFFPGKHLLNRLVKPVHRKQRDPGRKMLFPVYWLNLSYFNLNVWIYHPKNDSLCVWEKLSKLSWRVIDVVKYRINKYSKNVNITPQKMWKPLSMRQEFRQQLRLLILATMFFQKKDRLSFENKTEYFFK